IFALQAADLDLRLASVIALPNASKPEQKAVQMLVEEIEKRTQIRLPVMQSAPPGRPIIRLARAAPGRLGEGYRLTTTGNEARIEGNDTRGVLFGAGRFLREAYLSKQAIHIPIGLAIDTAPKYPLRGHQLGYRPKTNSYDAWSLPMWEQYIRDLAIF